MAIGLKIYKVNSIPTVLVPSALYLVRDPTTLSLSVFVSDNTGTTLHGIQTVELEGESLLSFINSLKDQPGGIAGIDQNDIMSSAVRLNGQDNLIVTSGNGRVWYDLTSNFIVRNFNGGNNPSFGVVQGNLQGLLFSATTMNQVWCDYHISHDIALGTKLYPHVHWMPITDDVGVVRWGIEYTVAKGHQQQSFHSPVTVYVTQHITTPSRFLHCIAEVSELDAVPAINVEPDSFVKIRVFRDAVNDSYPAAIHAWHCDLHYQIERTGTINRAPNFYGE